jgi:hypothetical protein
MAVMSKRSEPMMEEVKLKARTFGLHQISFAQRAVENPKLTLSQETAGAIYPLRQCQGELYQGMLRKGSVQLEDHCAHA